MLLQQRLPRLCQLKKKQPLLHPLRPEEKKESRAAPLPLNGPTGNTPQKPQPPCRKPLLESGPRNLLPTASPQNIAGRRLPSRQTGGYAPQEGGVSTASARWLPISRRRRRIPSPSTGRLSLLAKADTPHVSRAATHPAKAEADTLPVNRAVMLPVKADTHLRRWQDTLHVSKAATHPVKGRRIPSRQAGAPAQQSGYRPGAAPHYRKPGFVPPAGARPPYPPRREPYGTPTSLHTRTARRIPPRYAQTTSSSQRTSLASMSHRDENPPNLSEKNRAKHHPRSSANTNLPRKQDERSFDARDRQGFAPIWRNRDGESAALPIKCALIQQEEIIRPKIVECPHSDHD